MWPFFSFPVWFSWSVPLINCRSFGNFDKAFNRSEATRAAALSISKASDRIWHPDLCHKLKSCEILSKIFSLNFFFSLFLEKNHLLRYWGCLSPLNWIEAPTLSPLIILTHRKFLLRGIILLTLLSTSTNILSTLAWSTVVMSGLVVLASSRNDREATEICRAIAPLLATSIKLLACRRNEASWSLFYRYYFGKCLFDHKWHEAWLLVMNMISQNLIEL